MRTAFGLAAASLTCLLGVMVAVSPPAGNTTEAQAPYGIVVIEPARTAVASAWNCPAL